MSRVVEKTLLASADRTTSGNSGSLDLEPEIVENALKALRVQLDVTAASGTGPTLDVVVEDSLDGSN